jgi:uncharacterized protein (DUF849 family)
VAADVVAAIRQKCPVLINLTTGTIGNKGAMGGGWASRLLFGRVIGYRSLLCC